MAARRSLQRNGKVRAGAAVAGAFAALATLGACGSQADPQTAEQSRMTDSSTAPDRVAGDADADAAASTTSTPSTTGSPTAATDSAPSREETTLGTVGQAMTDGSDTTAATTDTSLVTSAQATDPDSVETTTTRPPQVVENEEYGFAQILPDGFEPADPSEQRSSDETVFVNQETGTIIRIYAEPKGDEPSPSNTAASSPTDEASTSTLQQAASSSTTASVTPSTSLASETPSTTTTSATPAPLAPTTTALVPVFNGDNSDIAATDFATQQVSAPTASEGGNVVVTSTVDVGTHVVVVEVEGTPDEVEETIEETSHGLVLRDPNPWEVRLSDSISFGIPAGFAATSSSADWLEYTSASTGQTITVIGGVSAGAGSPSSSGRLAMIDQYGQPTSSTAPYGVWSAVEAEGRAVGEIVVTAGGSSYSISIDGPTAAGVNSQLSTVRQRLILTDY